jgi:hypothetical protein
MHSSQTECLISFFAAQLHVDLDMIGRCRLRCTAALFGQFGHGQIINVLASVEDGVEKYVSVLWR